VRGARPELRAGKVGHAWGVTPGRIRFSAFVYGGPRDAIGSRVWVSVSDAEAVALATELLLIVRDRARDGRSAEVGR